MTWDRCPPVTIPVAFRTVSWQSCLLDVCSSIQTEHKTSPAATPYRHRCSSLRSSLHYPLTKHPYKNLDYTLLWYCIQHSRVYLSWFLICPPSLSSLLGLTNGQSLLTELFRVLFFLSSKEPHLKSSLRDFEALITWWISIPQTHPLYLDFSSVFIL